MNFQSGDQVPKPKTINLLKIHTTAIFDTQVKPTQVVNVCIIQGKLGREYMLTYANHKLCV